MLVDFGNMFLTSILNPSNTPLSVSSVRHPSYPHFSFSRLGSRNLGGRLGRTGDSWTVQRGIIIITNNLLFSSLYLSLPPLLPLCFLRTRPLIPSETLSLSDSLLTPSAEQFRVRTFRDQEDRKSPLIQEYG